MKRAVVKDGIITNVIEAKSELPGTYPLSDGQWIGDEYREPLPEAGIVDILEDIICGLDMRNAGLEARLFESEDAICELDIIVNGG